MHNPNRRDVLKTSLAFGAGCWLGTSPLARAQSANDKLNVACIGIGGRGAANVKGVSSQNIVALCDVDDKKAGGQYQKYPKAKKYKDFRKMLDKMDKSIDAVVISTPDHTHYHPARQSMLMGKHVYCEKPLAHTVWEARELTKLAKKANRATQLGNQRHAFDGMRQTVEAVRSGIIGNVTEVYCAIGGSRGMPELPTEFPPVPATLDWDLWLGPAKKRPYSPAYCPYKWRFWWDFGTGETGNWGCHILDIPFWALQLKHPTRVDLDRVPDPSEIDPQRTPKGMQTRLEFPAEPGHGPVVLHWWHGSIGEVLKKYGVKLKGNTLFVGSKGVISADFRKHEVKMFDGQTAGESTVKLPKLPGFHDEWITACKGGARSSCDFVEYTGPLAEAVLLANAAYRSGAGFNWDAKGFKASGNSKIDEFLYPDFRDGWKI